MRQKNMGSIFLSHIFLSGGRNDDSDNLHLQGASVQMEQVTSLPAARTHDESLGCGLARCARS
jgi:hypothetical protein